MTEFREGDRAQLTGEEVTVEDPITVHNAHNYEQDAGAYQPDMSGRTVADPQDVGRESAAAPTPVAPDTPRSNAEAGPVGVCECGHGRDEHTATGPVSNCRVGSDSPRLADECTCLIYRPATPSTEETR